ncbi:MAG: hypothetical protein IJO76_02920 [Clostridia bacterium]|nr:hypothetical protein [Clostridia bacterium]
MFTYILDLLLAATAAVMLWKGHFGLTRQIALAPLTVACVDAAFAHQIQLSLTPVLSAVLVLLQIVVLLGCGAVLHHDRVQVRNKQARRQRRRQVARARAAFELAAERGQAPRSLVRVA